MVDTNKLSYYVTDNSSNILDDCPTSCPTDTNELISTDKIIEKTQNIENLISVLQNNISKKELEVNNNIIYKLDKVRSNKDSLQSSRNALRNSEATQNYTLQLQKYNLQNSFKQIQYLQKEVDQKTINLDNSKNKLNLQKKTYCKQANDLFKLLEQIANEKQYLLDNLDIKIDDI